MKIVNFHVAKTYLSRLFEKVCAGESFMICKAGRPIVKVVTLDAPDPPATGGLGFMAGEIETIDDFDQLGVGCWTMAGMT